MLHWLPYDEQALFQMLRVTRAQAEAWMSDDRHHTLAQLVRRRGLEPSATARRLVARWAGDQSARRRALLRERALRTLTQGHLSQHVFFHVFHQPEVGARADSVFGVTPMRYLAMRRSGYTPGEIGRRGGRSRAQTARAIGRVWNATASRGARLRETPGVQATRFAGHQASVLGPYLDSSLHPTRPRAPLPAAVGDTPVPHLRLLCTIFAGAHRATEPINYGLDADRLGRRAMAVCRVRRSA
jgi:hypothetical protein